MEQTQKDNSLGTQPIGKLLLRYAIPSVVSMVVNALYNIVDQIFIGQGVGYVGNAATNIILPLTTAILALGQMIGDGAAAYMSLQLGRGNSESAAQSTGNAITLSILVSLVLTVLFEIFLEPLCKLFGATESVLPYAMDYGRIIIYGFVFSTIDVAFGTLIRADGRPTLNMIGLLIGCIANCILDPLFIFVFGWGVKGAAWATIIGQGLNALFFIICAFRFKMIKLRKPHFILKAAMVGKILSMGVASFITQIAMVLVIAITNNVLTKYGAASKYGPDIPLAAMGITQKITQIVTSITLGIATGAQPIIGFNYGSGQYSRVKKTFKLALISSTIILVVAFFIFQFAPHSIVALFGDESDLYTEFAVMSIRVFLLLCPCIGVGCVTGIFFQAIGKPVQSAFLTLLRQIIVLLPAILILSYFIGVEGVLWAGPLGDGISAIVSAIVTMSYWKKIFPAEVKK